MRMKIGIAPCLLSLLLVVFPLMAKEEAFGCIVGDCETGRGVLVLKTERGVTRYDGDFLEGRYHGFGRLEHEGEGWVYKGRWVLGKKSGRGTHWDKDNNVYIGQWKNDRRHGQGSYFFAVEDWKEDQFSEAWLRKNTENYTGGFRNDVFYGQGTYQWKDGTRYVGGFAANKKHGEGYFLYSTGFKSKQKFEFDERVYE